VGCWPTFWIEAAGRQYRSAEDQIILAFPFPVHGRLLIPLTVNRDFFSREEPRAHVHVQHASGEAKFWLGPRLELAQNYGLTRKRIQTALRIVQEHQDEIRAAWAKHFSG
jgi:hypothetical protein